MLAAVLLIASAPTALDAERAFAAAARKDGQWAAFRRYAAPEATMFVPQPVNAQAWLRDRKDPPKAIERWPTASYVSCDGTIAVNTGGWKRSDGSVGYFSTVWQRQTDKSWKWVLDSGDESPMPRAQPIKLRQIRAACRGGGRQKFFFVDGDDIGGGRSRDKTLRWGFEVLQDGTRVVSASLWTGNDYKQTISDGVVPK